MASICSHLAWKSSVDIVPSLVIFSNSYYFLRSYCSEIDLLEARL